jgi:hypothetical protein
VVEDPGGDVGDVVESHAGQFDARLLFVALHDGVVEPALVPEVAVDSPFVDPRPFCDRSDGQLAPVTHR